MERKGTTAQMPLLPTFGHLRLMEIILFLITKSTDCEQKWANYLFAIIIRK